VVGAIWKATFRKIKKAKKKVRKVLILGLGGGTAATLIQKYWPGADIIGVDIDPLIIELGRKYLGLTGVRVVVNDAKAYLLRNRPKSEYNLVIVDTYLGYEYPKAFEKEEFLLLVKKSLAPGGMAVFNRLYFSEKRTFSQKFADKLEKIFTSVERYFPEANLMLLCRP
jgi:spermidine synthase